MTAGLTFEQHSRFAEVRCENGHRFDGVNYPTPEGMCPRCNWPEVEEYINRYQRLVAESAIQPPRQPLHQSVGLLQQYASPSLTASSERQGLS